MGHKILGLFNRVEMVQIEPLVLSGTIEPFDMRVLCWFARLVAAEFDLVLVSP